MGNKVGLNNMKSLPSTYILTPIDHKSTAEVADTTLWIDKSYENNLRERNPQLGVVEAICDDNPLQLAVGDVVAVNHFTFYGDIGQSRGFQLQPHVEWDGKRLFRVLPRQIYFKYNSAIPEPIGDVVICTDVAERDILGFNPNTGDFFHSFEFEQRGEVLCGIGFDKGDEVLVLKSAFYLITLDKVDYFKVMRNEIVATVRDGVATPVGNNCIVKYRPDEYQNGYSPLLWGTGISIGNNVTADIVTLPQGRSVQDFTPLLIDGGDGVQVYRNQGVPFGDCWIVTPDTILYAGEYEKA